MSARSNKRPTRWRLWGTVGVLVLGFGAAGLWGVRELWHYQKGRLAKKHLAAAQEAAGEEDWAAAAINYRAYVEKFPDDARALRAYGDVLLKLMAGATGGDVSRRWGQAAGVFKRLARILPDEATEDKAAALKELAGLYMKTGQFDDVSYTVKRWLAVAPDSVEALVMEVDALTGLGKPGEAIKALEEGVQQHPDAETLYTRLIRLRVGPERDMAQARKWVDAALKACPKSWSVRLEAHYYASVAGDKVAARHHLDDALRLAPDNVRVLVAASQYALRQGDFGQAKTYLDRARPAASESRADRLMVLTTEALWARRQPSKTERLRVADALQAEARDASVPLLLLAAELYIQAGSFDKADHCIATLDTLAGADLQMPTIKGARALAEGRAAEAVPLLEQGLANEPSNGSAAYLLGLARLRAGMVSAARDAFQTASELEPKAVGPRLQIARFAVSTGDYVAAETQVAAILKIAPDHAEARRLDMQLDFRRLAQKTPPDATKLARFQKRLATALDADPENPDLIRLSAATHMLRGQPDQAEALLRARMSVPALSESMGLTLADFYVRRKKTDAAQTLLREVWKQHPASVAAGQRLVTLLVDQDHLEDARAAAEKVEDEDLKWRLWRAIGTAASRTGKRDAALQAFERTVALLPKDIATRQRLLRFQSVTDDRRRADQLVQEITAIEGEGGQIGKVERARLLLMRKTQAPDGVGAAIAILESVVAKQSKWLLPILMLAQAYDEQHQVDAAIDQYARAVELAPQLMKGPVAIRYAVLLKSVGRVSEADALMEKISRQQPDSPAVLFQLAEQKSREGNWSEAADLAVDLLEKQSDNAVLAAMTSNAKLQAGKPEEALRIARDALKRTPDAIEPLGALVAALMATERSDEAEREVRAFIKRHAKNPSAHILLGQVLAASGRMAEADAAYEHAASLAPDQAPVLQAAGNYFGRRGEREKQLGYLRRAITLGGHDPDVSPVVARVLLTSTQPADRAEGVRMVERAMKAAGPNPDPALLVLSAGVLADPPNPDYEEAIARVKRALKKAPRMLDAYRMLGRLYVATRALDHAYDAFSQGLSVAPKDPSLIAQRGRVAMAQRRWKAAEADFETAVKLAPQNPAPQGALALAIERGAMQMAQPERRKYHLARAAKLLRARCEQNPTRATFLIDRLQFLGRRRRYADIKTLVEQRPPDLDDAQAVRFAGASLLVLGESDAELKRWGVGVLDDLIAAGFRVGNALVTKGIYLQRQDRIDEAESVLRQAVETEPDNGEAINALAWVYCEDQDNPDRAFKLLDPYIRQHRTHLEALDTYGVILFRQGKTDASIAVFQECLKSARPETIVEIAVKFHLGRALHKNGRIADGRRLIREALDHELSGQVFSSREQREAKELLR